MSNVFKNKWFWIILVVIGIILFIYLSGRAAGKRFVPKDVQIPIDTQPDGSTSTFNPGPYTDAIFNDIDEIFGFHSSVPYEALNKLSNSGLVAVYNDWNRRYYSKDNETIVQAIQGEIAIINPFSDFGGIKRAILQRYESLNLV